MHSFIEFLLFNIKIFATDPPEPFHSLNILSLYSFHSTLYFLQFSLSSPDHFPSVFSTMPSVLSLPRLPNILPLYSLPLPHVLPNQSHSLQPNILSVYHLPFSPNDPYHCPSVLPTILLLNSYQCPAVLCHSDLVETTQSIFAEAWRSGCSADYSVLTSAALCQCY
jgi:hypothetical protein